MSKINSYKSDNAGFQVYYNVSSSSSDSSTSSSSSKNSDTPLRRFNRLVRSSVARHWSFFRRDQISLRTRGRSVSDAGLCTIIDNDLDFLDYPRRSLQVFNSASAGAIPGLSIKSVGGSSAVGIEEASDGSDAERSRRHLRVPTPTYLAQSTGNFASGAAGGGCGAPRSAPATPLQLEPHSRSKSDKNAVKPLSGSAPSVRVSGLASGDEATDGKQPSKSRQKKFQRHFPQVGPEERVLNYYSCALVGDLLLQGHLYITKNYFAFYSNVFGYVTKLLIPTTSVLRITKEKVARIIPNAVGVCTRDERHVFGSLLSRDSTYKLMLHVWKSARVPELAVPEPQELRSSEIEASEYSPEDDSSSGGADHIDAPTAPVRPESEAIIAAAGAAVIQPALLTGSAPPRRAPRYTQALLLLLTVLLTCSAAFLAYRLYHCSATHPGSDSGEELYSELMRWRAQLHGRAATELHGYLSTNLLLLMKVRQSLESLSDLILTDTAQGADINIDIPNDTVFS